MQYEQLLKEIPITTNMINQKHAATVLRSLEYVIYKGVCGDVVELGCNVGTTSVFIQSLIRCMNIEGNKKQFHVYDSFEGLPPTTEHDHSVARTANPGDLKVSKEWFVSHFNELNLPLPQIHEGWFADQEYPDVIAFAFFDGDFYQSIMDSWEKVFPRLAEGAIVCVHDYGYPPLVGVKAACDDFFRDKDVPYLQYWDDYMAIFIF